jgi:serine/threonine protein kinase
MSDEHVAGRWTRVKQLFSDALSLTEPERRAFLARACTDDLSLRDEVDALLRAHDAAGDLFDRCDTPIVSALAHAGVAFKPTEALLAPGSRLGPYEIVERLGAGGMGEVYRVHDVRLHRDVALKTLPRALVGDPERRERFVQEARAASALEHPHIAAIHDIGEADGITFIAMELVRGEPLADRIARSPLTPVRALDLAIEIGEALARAHDRGIVHRDLKPANVMLTEDGHAKIIDFGLAKLLDVLSGDDRTRTGDGRGSSGGAVLGTASYMSPEQARGEPVDRRSDVFSFGIVLYEMLTGHPPFRGRSAIDTMHAILYAPAAPLPDLGVASDDLQRIVTKCLAKEPHDRYQGMRDAVVDLRAARRRIDSSAFHPAAVSERRNFHLYAAAAVLAAAAIAAWPIWKSSARSIDPTARPAWTEITNLDFATQPALSPDGRLLAFIRGDNTFSSPGNIYLKMLPDGAAVPLTHDAVAKMGPTFSPDGSQVAYTVAEAGDKWQTWVIPTLRGEPRMWLPNASALTWTNHGQVLYSQVKGGIHTAIITASESGTDARDVYVPRDPQGMAHRSFLSPDGRQVLVVEMDHTGVWLPCRIVPFDGSSAGRSIGHANAACTGAAWSPDGRWAYINENVGSGFHIWRQAINGSRLEQVTASPTEEEGIAMAPDGRSFITSVGLRQRSVWVHDPTGERQLSVEGYAYWPLMSGDGTKICYRLLHSANTGQAPAELWVTDLSSGRNDRLLPGRLVTGYDVAGDRAVAAVAEPHGGSSIWLVPLDPRQPPLQVPGAAGDNPRFVRAGRIVLRQRRGGDYRLVTMNDDGTAVAEVSASVPNVLGTLSPSGEWLSVSGQGGMILYSISRRSSVVFFAGPDSARVRWSRDGSHIYVSLQYGAASAFGVGRTYVVPLAHGSELPAIPSGGFKNETDLAAIPGTQVLPYGDLALGAARDVYAYSRAVTTRNLYRVIVQ